jgi:flagellar basal-body rod protein FlgG
MRALHIAATGMNAQQMRVEVISNNLANMNTTGYKTRRAEFADLHYQQLARPGSIAAADGSILPTGVQLGLGVRPAAVSMTLEQGTVTETRGDLDLAIEGAGWFEVLLPSGASAYSRDGSFERTGDGLIVTSDGFALQPEITIPDEAFRVSINADGEVYAHFRDTVDPELLGQITLTRFTNAKGLEAIGGNLFLETPASGPPVTTLPGTDGSGSLRQGYLENATVDAVREVTQLIEAQRGYELNSKVITAVDQMMAATGNVR